MDTQVQQPTTTGHRRRADARVDGEGGGEGQGDPGGGEHRGGYGLRLRVVGGGCSGFAYDLYFDQVTEMDRTFDSHGVKLVVDQMSLQYLAGTTVDYVEGLQGAGFKFGNPNVKSTCGCGSSFSV